jgi:hypothetical protein
MGSLAIPRLLAGHGVAALPIGFWNLPGLPDAMLHIDVEGAPRPPDTCASKTAYPTTRSLSSDCRAVVSSPS